MKLRKIFFDFVYSITICFALCNASNSNQCSGSQYQSECITGSLLIGKPCTNSSQCVESETKKSECADMKPNGVGVCRCLKDYVGSSDNKKCLSKDLELGQQCEESIQCVEFAAGKSECKPENEVGICSCLIDFVESSDHLKCLSKDVELGQPCEESVQCVEYETEKSECSIQNEDKVCNCLSDFVESSDHLKCLLKNVELGQPCEESVQCVEYESDKSECSLKNEDKVCSCLSDFVGSSDHLKCLSKDVQIGQPCEETQQCVGGSECIVSGSCRCIGGFVPSTDLGKCLKVIDSLNDEINGICEEKQQCQAGKPGLLSNCSQVTESSPKVCTCTIQAVSDPSLGDNFCYEKATEVGYPCQIELQCESGLGHSYCFENTCICKDGYTESTNKTKCIPEKDLGQICEDNNQCSSHIPNSVCAQLDPSNPEAFCKCEMGYLNPSGSVKECYLLATEVGGSCENHEVQCDGIDHSQCNKSTSTCECEESYLANPSKTSCLPQADLNLPCDESVQCQHVNNTECRLNNDLPKPEKQCQCLQNKYVESEKITGTCVEIRNEINLNCTEDVMCTAGLGNLAGCIDYVCQCRGSYQYYNGRCYINARLGSVCSQNEECYAGVNNLTVCALSDNPPIRRCRCQTETIEFSNSCYAKKQIGDLCGSNEECTVSILGEVHCDPMTMKCSCRTGYSQFGEKLCASGSLNLHQYSFILPLLMYFGKLILA